jgi:MFS family permease
VILADLGLLKRRRDLRLLIGGFSVSMLGGAFTQVALFVQVYDLTGSTLAVGLLGAAEFVPIVALALVGGALADAFDRRKLIFGSELVSVFIAVALLVNALLPSPQLWVLYVAAALFAAAAAVLRPPLDALFPLLVERDELKAAAAIHGSLANVSQIAGPALAGVLIAATSVSVAYAIDVGSFVLSLTAFALMRTPPPAEDAERPSLKGVVDGLRYAVSRQELLGSYVIDMNAMFFGMPFALFPAFAERYGGTSVVGLLWAAPAVGSIVSMVTSGWAARVHHNGRAIVLAAAAWGVAIAGFGVAHTLWPALLMLVLAGAADGISGIFRGALWNETIPDRLRGRLAGVEMISWSSGPLLGNARAGASAGWWGLGPAVVIGGGIVVAGSAVLAALLPRFWNYDSRE